MEKQAERFYVLGQLAAAVNLLAGSDRAYGLIPEVRSNIAMSLRDPVGPGDVAAIPGRLTVVNQRITAAAYPQWAASVNTAAVLLYIKEKLPQRRAVMEIRYSPQTLAVLAEQGLEALELRAFLEQEVGEVAPRLFYLEPGLGREGTLIVSHETALEVAETVLRIADLLDPAH